MFHLIYGLLGSAVHGDVSATSAALTMTRVGVGLCFAITGFWKLANHDRHMSMQGVLKAYGLDVGPHHVLVWFVSSVEFLGGIALTIGFLTPFAVVPLATICAVAIMTDGKQRVEDEVGDGCGFGDRLSTWLYLPEMIWSFVLVTIAVAGSGPYSVDAFLF